MILSDRTIRELLAAGRIAIEPLDDTCIQPSSVDLRLDKFFRVFLNHTMSVIDVRKDLSDLTQEVEIAEGDAFILHPGEFVLGSTSEKISLPDDIVARIEGKSSLGRLGLLIHSSLPGSETVLVLDGDRLVPMPIEDIVRKQRRVRVAAFDPDTFEVGYHEITGWYEGPPDRIFEVELASGRRVRVTAGHNLFTLDRAGRLAKVRTGELRPGARVAVPRVVPDPAPPATGPTAGLTVLERGAGRTLPESGAGGVVRESGAAGGVVPASGAGGVVRESGAAGGVVPASGARGVVRESGAAGGVVPASEAGRVVPEPGSDRVTRTMQAVSDPARADPDPVPPRPVLRVVDHVPDPAPAGLSVAGPTVRAAFEARGDLVAGVLRGEGYGVADHRRRAALPFAVAAQVPGLLGALGPDDVVVERDGGDPVPARITVDADLAWFLGLHLAQGGRRAEQVVVANADQVVLDRAAATLSGLGLTVARDADALSVGSSALSALLEWLGAGDDAPTRRVPAVVFGWPHDLVAAFLDGMVAGNGSAEGGRASVETTSPGLVADLLLLFARLGRTAVSRRLPAHDGAAHDAAAQDAAAHHGAALDGVDGQATADDGVDGQARADEGAGRWLPTDDGRGRQARADDGTGRRLAAAHAAAAEGAAALDAAAPDGAGRWLPAHESPGRRLPADDGADDDGAIHGGVGRAGAERCWVVEVPGDDDARPSSVPWPDELPGLPVDDTEARWRLDRLVDGDLLWDEVVAVHDTGVTETIYDLEVRPGGRKVENFLAGSGGVFVSNTAGFIDAGFSGHITLELSNVANLPITLYPGMKIGQVSFLRMTTPADVPYGSAKVGSKYQGQRGPTPSRYWENFDDSAAAGG